MAEGTVKLADLLDEAEERAFKVVSDKNPELAEGERREIARVVGLGGDEQVRPLGEPSHPEGVRQHVEHRDHRLEVLGQDGFFLLRRPPLGAADAGEDGGDVAVGAVGAVECFAALREIPAPETPARPTKPRPAYLRVVK